MADKFFVIIHKTNFVQGSQTLHIGRHNIKLCVT
jgi:hypothetical protein